MRGGHSGSCGNLPTYTHLEGLRPPYLPGVSVTPHEQVGKALVLSREFLHTYNALWSSKVMRRALRSKKVQYRDGASAVGGVAGDFKISFSFVNGKTNQHIRPGT